MAHFAILKAGNIVEEVVVVSNEIATNEQAGIEFLKQFYKNPHLPVVQTSYNNSFRKNFAGIGYQYDQTRDAFIAPKPFNSWILNEDTCRWEAPVAMPSDMALPPDYIGTKYFWNESATTWDIVE
jgi:hypothetical protein